jgi:isochorismate pyruvate lyase
MKAPSDCNSMTELRAAIDVLDAQIVAALARRAAYIDRAAELKTEAQLPARITERVEEVVENVRARAVAEGLDPALIESLWRALIEWSIAREEVVLGPSTGEETQA